MMQFETINELTLKITTTGHSTLFTKTGAFIGGECFGNPNYKFDKVLFGPENNAFGAIGRQMLRRITGENLPLTKVESSGDNVLYFANKAQHVLVYQLAQGETISVESENILAFTADCKYDVKIMAQGIFSQKGLCTSTLTGIGPEAFVAIVIDGNPIVLSNIQNGATITTDPDATVCWIGTSNDDPEIKMNVSWKTFVGQSSGESYAYEWRAPKKVTVIIQPNERDMSGAGVGMDGGASGSQPTRQTSRVYY
jgi:uncharacterized protein (AIM24 family)